MLNPSIQNDFSYYRRSLNRMKLSKKHLGEITIKDELANRMSLFYAYPTPMMNVINESTTNFFSKNQTILLTNMTTALALMSSICEDMVSNKRFQKDETNMFCLRCMTGAIILYDHTHPIGAFHKKSGIPIRGLYQLDSINLFSLLWKKIVSQLWNFFNLIRLDIQPSDFSMLFASLPFIWIALKLQTPSESCWINICFQKALLIGFPD